PLQETYLESAYYWMGAQALFGLNSWESYLHPNGWHYIRSRPSVPNSLVSGTNNYSSPIVGACQRNYSVYLTDGLPVRDVNGTALITTLLNDPTYNEHTSRACENPDGFGSGGECLDELAEFLFANDFNDSLPGKQNVVSHFIGFGLDEPFLQRAADAGGGTYYPANDADTLRNALGAIFNNVADDVNGFTAPAVTVNDFDRTTHLDQLYFTVFQPSDAYVWDGNVKRYKFEANEQDDGLSIVGQDGELAVNAATGFFYDGRDQLGNINPNVPTAWSWWSSAPDGADVNEGGAVEQMYAFRNILTNTAGTTLSAINRENQTMRDALIGYPVPYTAGDAIPWPANADDTVVDRWLDWAAGIDSYDRDGDGSFTDTRNSMGDPLHSKPSVVTYGGVSGLDTVIYMGTNEGFVHGINGETGKELFGFMPRELWSNIPYWAENPKLGLNKRRYGMDGPITVWKDDGGDGKVDIGTSDRVILYIGMRRGGRSLYAMDVTNPYSPELMWTFDQTDDSEMGESWSAPLRTRMNFGTTESPNEKDVIIFGGGYYDGQDNATSVSSDGHGNAIYIVDALSGALLWSASNDSGQLQLADMTNSIPSSIRAVDLNLDGNVDRMYAVDIVGRLFRFDVHNETSFEITGGVIAELGGTASGGPQNMRRFYYAPDIALGNDNGRAFLTLTLASGYRANPLETQINDYLLGIRDYKPFEVLGEENDDYDYDIDLNDLTELSSAGGTVIPSGSAGFKLPITQSGEKSLARSRVFQNTAFYSTYVPGSAPANNPCAPAVGSGALYTIDLTTGEVVRDVLQKAGIPPEVTFLFGEPHEDDQTIDTCYGPHCTSGPDQQGQDACDAGDPDCAYEETQNTGRQIQCTLGPEACNAGGLETPTRTYWRQLNEDG
ncbi:MAG: PilC/PilY family type IV pilus protein, partial [Pseudomonadota bacterium]